MLYPLMKQGGIMMWPLLLCSVLLGALVIERCWSVLLKHRLLGRPLGDSRSMARNFEFFKEIPPGIGLLGTVIGVVKAFGLGEGQLTADTAAAGLGVACFTTVLGLSLSLIATVCEYVFEGLILNEDGIRQRA